MESFVNSVDGLSSLRSCTLKSRRVGPPLKNPCHALPKPPPSSSSLITFDRDPGASDSLDHWTDELRWLLIQYGPHQPRDDENQFLASAVSTGNGKGTVRFRSKWFDDIRFADWLEYSLSTGRAYCFYCRLFAESNRNRAFSRDGQYSNHETQASRSIEGSLTVLFQLGVKNWRKCLGSRGQKKKRSTGPSKACDDLIVCQRRGLLESHALSEAHKQCHEKYLTFVNRMHFETRPIENNVNHSKQSGNY